MRDILDQARKVSIPTKQEGDKIQKLADYLLNLVKKEAEKYPEVTLVELVDLMQRELGSRASWILISLSS